jgi:aryl-alcohol dehydrogenase-like predicted oxidoreductase
VEKATEHPSGVTLVCGAHETTSRRSVSLLESVLELRKAGEAIPLSLGAMNFGRRTDEAESKRIVARALELGIRTIDTANAYVDGSSERIVGEAVRGVRDKVVLATKCGFGRIDGRPEGLSRVRLLSAIDESLKRLGTDWVDIYYLHVPDHDTPIEETMDALAALFERKKIRAWGVSNYAAWQVLEMIHIADVADPPKAGGAPLRGIADAPFEKRGLPRPVIAQQLYNILVRQLDAEYLPFARRYKLHTAVYNPLAGGLLTGRHARDGSTQKGSRFEKNRMYQGRYFTDAMFDRVDALAEVAKAEGMSVLELAYAWLAGAAGVDSILVGPASVSQLDEGAAACRRSLSPEVRGTIDALQRAWLGTDTCYVR